MQVYCADAALVWQLMKAYTLSILTRLAGTGHPIVDKQIIEWANDKVSYLVILTNCICSLVDLRGGPYQPQDLKKMYVIRPDLLQN